MALQALRAIARALSDPLSPSEVADVVAQWTFERFGATSSVVYLNDGPHEVKLAAFRGLSERTLALIERLSLPEGDP